MCNFGVRGRFWDVIYGVRPPNGSPVSFLNVLKDRYITVRKEEKIQVSLSSWLYIKHSEGDRFSLCSLCISSFSIPPMWKDLGKDPRIWRKTKQKIDSLSRRHQQTELRTLKCFYLHSQTLTTLCLYHQQSCSALSKATYLELLLWDFRSDFDRTIDDDHGPDRRQRTIVLLYGG